MPAHLVKIAVGVTDVDHLASLQQARVARMVSAGQAPVLRHVTRNTPRRAAEIVDGGSMYWVIRGFIRVRQRIVRFETANDEEGRAACAIVLDPRLQRTALEPFRPFQGWRYLDAAKAPYDVRQEDGGQADEMPPGLAEELRQLGLL